MNVVKNIHRLGLQNEDLEALEKGAALYKAHANISFKILSSDDQTIVVEVRQEQNKTNQYQDQKGLSTRAKDLFAKFFPSHKIHARPKPFAPPVVDIVTDVWISSRMGALNMRTKDIQDLTGISKANISSWINGKRVMSQPVKAMFYFLLK